MLTSHIDPHKGIISLMWLPAQKFDLLIVSDSGMGLMPAQSAELTSQSRMLPHSCGLCSLATWEAQMPPGELGPRARSLVWITGKLGGASQMSPEENPGKHGTSLLWIVPVLVPGALLFSMLPSPSKFLNPGWLIHLCFRNVGNIVVLNLAQGHILVHRSYST